MHCPYSSAAFTQVAQVAAKQALPITQVHFISLYFSILFFALQVVPTITTRKITAAEQKAVVRTVLRKVLIR